MVNRNDKIGGTTGTQNQQGVVETNQPNVQVGRDAQPRVQGASIGNPTTLFARSVQVGVDDQVSSPLERAEAFLQEASDHLLAHPDDFDKPIKLLNIALITLLGSYKADQKYMRPRGSYENFQADSRFNTLYRLSNNFQEFAARDNKAALIKSQEIELKVNALFKAQYEAAQKITPEDMRAHPENFEKSIEFIEGLLPCISSYDSNFIELSLKLSELCMAKYDSIPDDQKDLESLKFLEDARQYCDDVISIRKSEPMAFQTIAQITVKMGDFYHLQYTKASTKEDCERIFKDMIRNYVQADGYYHTYIRYAKDDLQDLKEKNQHDFPEGFEAMNRELDEKFVAERAEVNSKSADLSFKIAGLYESDLRRDESKRGEYNDRLVLLYKEAMTLGHPEAMEKLIKFYENDPHYQEALRDEALYRETGDMKYLEKALATYKVIISKNELAKNRFIEWSLQSAQYHENLYREKGDINELRKAYEAYRKLSVLNNEVSKNKKIELSFEIAEYHQTYFNNTGEAEHFNQAFEHYSQAAELGHPGANDKRMELEFKQAEFIEFGEKGFEMNKQNALEIYETLKDQGHLGARFKYGVMHVTGDGVAPNDVVGYANVKTAAEMGFPDALDWMEMQAEEQNDVVAQLTLGDFYRQGATGAADLERASYFYLKAEAKGDKRASFELGKMFEGAGDMKDAIQHFEKGAENGSFDCARSLSVLYLSDVPQVRNIQKALKQLTFLANGMGDAEAAFKVGNLYYEGKEIYGYYSPEPTPSPEQAARFFKKAAIGGSLDGQYMLGMMHLNGEYFNKDIPQAMELLEGASDSGLGKATYQLADIYRKGVSGVPKDLKTALAMFEKASEQGDERAADMVRIVENEIRSARAMARPRA